MSFTDSNAISVLEDTFDIPFDETNGSSPSRWREISPRNRLEEFFSVRLFWRGAIRLIAELRPQKYAAKFVNSLGLADDGKRNDFASIVQVMLDRSSKVVMSINGVGVDPLDLSTWPAVGEKWTDVQLRAEVIVPYELYQNDCGLGELEDEWAILSVGAVLCLSRIEEDGTDSNMLGATEGDRYSVLLNKYERNPINRRLCIEKRGTSCLICGTNFEDVYGPRGRGFIHVHHIVPVSELGPGYRIRPEEDLIPVCPNCHAMLHRTTPPIMPTELKDQIHNRNPEDGGK